MIRSIVAVFCVVCVATILTEGLGLAFLWYRGQLSADNLREIRLVLRGESRIEEAVAADTEKRQPSVDDVLRIRAMSVLDLESRERELDVLKSAAITNEDKLIAERARFEERQRAFEERLAMLLEDAQSDATEQTRAILQTLPPDSAAERLTQLTLDEAVVLLKGMPEKSIARILGEFQKGPPQRQQRGTEIFEAIARGEPNRAAIEDAAESTGAQESRETASNAAGAMR